MLQNYEVGSTVMTPEGEGTVVRYHRTSQVVSVHTTTGQNPWKISELEGFVAGGLDTQELLAWMDAPEEPQQTTGLQTRQAQCACPCPGCYWTLRGGSKIMHFRNGDCRCQESTCVCLA